MNNIFGGEGASQDPEAVRGRKNFRQAITVAAWLLVAFLGVQVLAGVQGLRYIGAGVQPANTISVSGYGEAEAVPDVATFSFSILSDKATVAAAQDDATAKINAVTKYLTDSGVDKKDIQTSDYSVYPQYEYNNVVCITYPCPSPRQTLKGYEVRQSTTVKVRDTAKAGELLAGVGSKGATEVSGLNFTFDKPEAVQDEARTKAIKDAKSKADELARELGVRIVRVVSFNESGNYPGPIYYAKDMAAGTGGVAPQAAPEISVGQNKVTSHVTVTYEIR